MCIKEDEGEDKHHLQVALEKNITYKALLRHCRLKCISAKYISLLKVTIIH